MAVWHMLVVNKCNVSSHIVITHECLNFTLLPFTGLFVYHLYNTFANIADGLNK